jgi:DNA (cytosine-5)-methyltransferase 1
VDYVREDMNVPWMSRDGIRECIPPAYTEYIGKHLMAFLMAN